MSSSEVNVTTKDFFREDIWSEHSQLADRYAGHRDLIEWGRTFITQAVLPGLKERNERSIESDKPTTAYFWVSGKASTQVMEALRILSYTGVVSQETKGLRATKSETGTRYLVNLGLLLSQESTPSDSARLVYSSLSLKRMIEYTSNSSYFTAVTDIAFQLEDSGPELQNILMQPSSRLDLTDWQHSKLDELGLESIGEVLDADESVFLEAYYVGTHRARIMRNAAVAAVLEYISG